MQTVAFKSRRDDGNDDWQSRGLRRSTRLATKLTTRRGVLNTAAPMKTDKQKILVVEDDEALMMGLVENLKFAGYEAASAVGRGTTFSVYLPAGG